MNANTFETRSPFGVFLAAAFLGSILSFGAVAGEEPAKSDRPCANSVVDSEQAMEIAESYMENMGYDKYPHHSKWHYSFRDSSCVNGQWRINVDLGPHTQIKKRRMVLVNCKTGEVEDQVIESAELAVE